MGLLSFERKLERAGEHMEALRKVAPPTGNRDPLIRETNYETGKIVIRLADLDPFSILVGDALQNLRSTLDHIVYELIPIPATGVIDPKVLEGSEFPIFLNRAPRLDEIKKKIGSIDQGAQAFILGLQPHILGPNFMDHALARLHELARIDRHRSLLPGAYINAGTGFGGDNLHVVEMSLNTPNMSVPGAVVAEGVIRPIDPSRPMKMNLNMTAHVVFGDGPCIGQDAVTVLSDLDAYIRREVIDPLRSYLPPVL